MKKNILVLFGLFLMAISASANESSEESASELRAQFARWSTPAVEDDADEMAQARQKNLDAVLKEAFAAETAVKEHFEISYFKRRYRDEKPSRRTSRARSTTYGEFSSVMNDKEVTVICKIESETSRVAFDGVNTEVECYNEDRESLLLAEF